MKIDNYGWMNLLKSDETKIKILKTLSEIQKEISLNGIRKRIGAVNYNSVKRNCEFLKEIGLIKIEQKEIENRKYNFITITERGQEILDGLENGTTNVERILPRS